MATDVLDDPAILDDLWGRGSRSLPTLLRALLPDQRDEVLEALRGDDGTTSAREVLDFTHALILGAAPNLSMLVEALMTAEGALRASLRAVYGLDLRHPGVGVLDLADLVVGLPQGCALWRELGGPMAWSPEMQMLAGIEYNTHVLYYAKTKDAQTKKNPPKRLEPPKSKAVVAAEEAKAARMLERRRAKAATRARLNQNST